VSRSAGPGPSAKPRPGAGGIGPAEAAPAAGRVRAAEAASAAAASAAASASPAPRPVDPLLGLPADRRLRINEIFYSLQGESTFTGRPCVLVRLTGCQMRCRWCDTEYAFHEGSWMSLEEVLAEVAVHRCPLVEVTGGEPLLQPGTRPLLAALCDAGYEVLLETGGGLDVAGVDPRVRRIVDVKCPGSGEADKNDWTNLGRLAAHDEVKFVVKDRVDYEFVRDVINRHSLAGRTAAVLLSPVHGVLDPRTFSEWILADHLPVRLQLQVHKIVWAPETRGV
jgi:7-carboxy-7-deazaguanine synthase